MADLGKLTFSFLNIQNRDLQTELDKVVRKEIAYEYEELIVGFDLLKKDLNKEIEEIEGHLANKRFPDIVKIKLQKRILQDKIEIEDIDRKVSSFNDKIKLLTQTQLSKDASGNLLIPEYKQRVKDDLKQLLE